MTEIYLKYTSSETGSETGPGSGLGSGSETGPGSGLGSGPGTGPGASDWSWETDLKNPKLRYTGFNGFILHQII